jgi:type IV secretory pathway VirB10-like protein
VPDDPLRDDPLGSEGEDVLGGSGVLRPAERDVAADRLVHPAPPRLDGPPAATSLDDRPTAYFSRIVETPAAPVAPAPQPGLRAVLAPWAVFGAVGVLLIAATTTWASWLRGPAADQDAPFPTFAPMVTATSPAPAPPAAIAQPPTPTTAPEPEAEPDPEPTRRATERPRPTRERSPAAPSRAPAAPPAASRSATADVPAPTVPDNVAAGPSAGAGANGDDASPTPSGPDSSQDSEESSRGDDSTSGDEDEDSE